MITQLELDKWQIQKNMDDICRNRHKGNEQSVAANKKMAGIKTSYRYAIYAIIKKYHLGSTCEEVEFETGLPHQTASARISELKRDWLIEKVGTRLTRSGCAAAVYKAT